MLSYTWNITMKYHLRISGSFWIKAYSFHKMIKIVFKTYLIWTTSYSSIVQVGKLWPWAEFSSWSVFINKVLLEHRYTPLFLHLVYGWIWAITECRIIIMHTVWPAESKIFTIWPFKERVCQFLLYYCRNWSYNIH